MGYIESSSLNRRRRRKKRRGEEETASTAGIETEFLTDNVFLGGV